MQHPRFREGRLTTGFIAEEYPEGFEGAPASAELIADLAVIAAVAGHVTDRRACAVSGALNGPVAAPDLRVVRIAGAEHHVVIEDVAEGLLARLNGGAPVEVFGRWRPGQLRFRGSVDGRDHIVQVARSGRGWTLTTRGTTHKVQVYPAHVAELTSHMIEKVPPDLSKYLIAPMPGLLTALHVAEGDKVEAGQPLAVVEAMKMENILRAQKPATVSKVAAQPGDSLAVDAVILEFE